MLRPILVRVAVLFALLMTSSCASYPDAIDSGERFEMAARAAPKTAVLGPGATVQIKFLRTPELDEIQVVRADGRITMPMIGDVDVSEKTPSDVQAELVTAYAGKLRSPDIRVLVQKQEHRRIYVGGQVLRAGVVAMPGRMTALEAVMQAGGPDMRTAATDSVLVLRQEGEKRQGYLVNLAASLAGGEAKAFHLRNNDVVFVPRSTIAKVDQWVDQHINQLFPQFGLFFRKTLGTGSEWGFQTLR